MTTISIIKQLTYSMNSASLVAKLLPAHLPFAFIACTQGSKVFDGLGSDLSEKAEDDSASRSRHPFDF